MASEKKRNFYKEAILKTAKFSREVSDDVTEDNVNTQYDRCTDSWRCFQEVHLDILQVTGEEFIEYENIEFAAVEQVAMEVIPLFKAILRRFVHEDYESANSKSAVSKHGDDVINHSNGGLRVPYFKIPLFSGDYDAWPAFKDLFRSMIHFNNKMSPVQKLGYLKVNLSDEALRIIKNLEITDANYDTAWNLLADRYDNERILVNRWIHLIVSIPISKGDAAGIKAILDGTQEALQGLKNLNRPIDNYDDFLVYLSETKLDQKSKQRWEDEIAEVQNTAPKWDQMVSFLKTRFRSLEVGANKAVSSQEKSYNHSSQANNAKSSLTAKSSAVESSVKSNHEDFCLFCKKKHRLNFCFTFQKKPYNERLAFVEDKKICTNCLSVGHKSASCPSTYTCRICQQRHHTLLHVTKSLANVTLANRMPNVEAPFVTLLATALIHIENVKGMKIQLRVLIDQGSQVSFITTHAAKRLGLKGKSGGPAIKSVGVEQFVRTKGTAELMFSSRFNVDCKYQTTVTILDKITGQLPSEFIKMKLPTAWKKLSLADPKFYKPGSIDALLGADMVSEIIEEGLLRMTDHKVIAQKSTLGWLLSGKVKLSNPIPVTVTGNITSDEKNFEKLSQQLQAFWDLENIGSSGALDLDDQMCEEHFKATHYRDDNGRFVVRLPFKPSFRNYIRLGNSRNVAIYNWLSMERRMDKYPNLRATYTSIMDKLIENKYMIPVPTCELEVSPEESCYLVHHIVRRGRKDRIVFNASKKTSSGFSLNDALHIGPPLQKRIIQHYFACSSIPYCFIYRCGQNVSTVSDQRF